MSDINSSTSKGVRSTVEFFDGFSVDGYEMPDGHFRVGITTASIVAGFAENYLRRMLGDTGTRSKALPIAGFSGETTTEVRLTKTGYREERTIDLRDFMKLLRHGDRQGHASAGAMIDALGEMSLIDFFRASFSKRPLTIDEKRDRFYKTYAASISPEMWRQMDREEILDLALPGDERHLLRGRWNR